MNFVAPQTNSGVRILLVDDNHADVLLIRKILQDAGYIVHSAEDSEAALKQIEQTPPTLILLDIKMPGLNGFDLCRTLKADATTQNIPVIFISGLHDDDEKNEAFSVGGVDYIVKPIRKQELLARVTTHVTIVRNIRSLQRERDKAKLYLDLVGVIVVALNTHGQITQINQKGCDLLGYQEHELLGRDWFELCVPARLHAEAKETFKQIISGNLLNAEYSESSIVTRSGEERIIAWHNAYIKDENGNIIRSLSSGQDLTELQKIRRSLAQADRMASMGRLASGIAHELNNPLMYVKYNIESLAEDLEALHKMAQESQPILQEQLPPDARDALIKVSGDLYNAPLYTDMIARFQSASDGLKRMQEIIHGLSTFSHIDQEKSETILVEELLNHAVNIALNEIKYKARLSKDYQPHLQVVADPGQILQVFLHLLMNAAQAIEEGNVEQNEIRLKTWSSDDALYVEISDTGRGIPPEQLDRIFEPFFTTKDIGAGRGLGLSISKNIIEGYGGRIQAESEPGQGSRFLIRLPLLSTKQPKHASQERLSTPPRKPRILLVDDEEGIRLVLRRMLRAYDISEASSGEEALKLLEKNDHFDLVICDLMMPKVTGMELYEKTAATHPNLAQRFIFITGGVFTPKARKFLHDNRLPMLEKPFSSATLQKLVKRSLAQHSNFPPS